MLFMGIDVGSSGCKTSVINENGRVVSFSSREYSFEYSGAFCELDAEVVCKCVFETIKQLCLENDLSELKTISVTSFGEMFVLLDENRHVIDKSISYSDTRGSFELAEFSKGLKNDEIYKITGAVPDAMYSLAKLLYIKRNKPQIYEKATYFCMFADFILMMLGAEHHTDYSLAARTMMFDVSKKCWSDEILKRADIDISLLGRPVASGTRVGEISSKIASELSLPSKVTLLAGGHDQPCAALGAGILKSGTALDGMGSNECIVPAFDSLMINDTMKASSLVCVPHIAPGLYVTYAFTRTAGSLFKWYNGIIGGSYSELITELPDSPSGLFMLPHFAGAATPYMDDSSCGAIVGLNLGTTRGELTKSLLEGLNFEMLINLKCLERAGFRTEKLFAAGGMSRYNELLQLKADIMGIPVARLENSEPGTLGTAILGGIAMGAYNSFTEAADALVRTKEVFTPDTKKHEVYQDLFARYERLYGTVKEFYNN